MRNNTCHSSICYNLFRASQKVCRASKNDQLLARHGKSVLKLMLVPDDLTTEGSFDLQAMCILDALGLFFDMLCMGVCATRYWQPSGRLVQELNSCTVASCPNAARTAETLGKWLSVTYQQLLVCIMNHLQHL